MKESFRFDIFDPQTAIDHARDILGPQFTSDLAEVLRVAMSDIRNLPTLRFSDKTTLKLDDYVRKWSGKYIAGFNNRPSVRVGKKSSTYSDSVVKSILSSRLPNLDNDMVSKIENGHSLMMTIENLVGELLEEYLSVKLASDGWLCCWGNTIDAVDFCKPGGDLLQIKNSDNSENSSSSRVRSGTSIMKWFRRFSTKENIYNWEALNVMMDRVDLSETNFRSFIESTIKQNPSAIYIDPHHPLLPKNKQWVINFLMLMA